MLDKITKKNVIFGIAGLLGAVIANLFTEIFNFHSLSSMEIFTILSATIWVGIISLGIAASLLFAQNYYLKRKNVFNKELLNITLRGLLTGALSGAVAQIIFSLTYDTLGILSRAISWGIFGAGLGWGIALFVPNYPKKISIIAGFIGGFLGGTAFDLIAFGNDMLNRIVGISIVGFCIGFMISLLEEVIRKAWLEVEYNGNDKVNLSLGESPIIIGSSPEAHIYLPKNQNFLPITATILLKNGKVQLLDKANNQTFELKENSKFTVFGNINITVRTSK